MINGWIRDDLNLWQHLSQYSEVTEQSEYLTQYHRLHTFCLIVVLLNSCLKTVAQLFMFSTTPGCLWCSMIYLLRDIGWSPRYTLHVTQLRHVKLAVSRPRAGTRYPVSPHIHWFIVQKTTASLCPPPPSSLTGVRAVSYYSPIIDNGSALSRYLWRWFVTSMKLICEDY